MEAIGSIMDINSHKHERELPAVQGLFANTGERARPTPVPGKVIMGSSEQDVSVLFLHHWLKSYVQAAGVSNQSAMARRQR